MPSLAIISGGIALKTDYSILERWLHHIALGSSAVKALSHDIERARYLSQARKLAAEAPRHNKAVIVCGLARSGTTVLLQALDQLDTFASLTYRDMPFVLAPNLWASLTASQQQASLAQERAHGDGLRISADSPESFEEVFWQLETAYDLNTNSLQIPVPNSRTLERYRDYQLLVRFARRKPGAPLPRYLAKNNNHMARLAGLLAEPATQVVVVFRDPQATALSLHRQHQHFLSRHQANPFDRRYMHWLAHHEFGADHAPFMEWHPDTTGTLKPNTPDYWLSYWIKSHQALLNHADQGALLVSHARLCAQPQRQLRKLAEHLQCSQTLANSASLYRSEPLLSTAHIFTPQLITQANILHAQLSGHAATLMDT